MNAAISAARRIAGENEDDGKGLFAAEILRAVVALLTLGTMKTRIDADSKPRAPVGW